MSLCSTRCPHCNQEVSAQSEWNGMDITCPLCNRLFRLNIYQSKLIAPSKKIETFIQTETINIDGTISDDSIGLFTGFARFSQFNGRSSRRELAMFFMGQFLVNFILSLLSGFSAAIAAFEAVVFFSAVSTIFSLASIVPYLSTTVRRLHDVEWHWALVFIPGIQFVLLFVPSSGKDNKYGEAPYDGNIALSILVTVITGVSILIAGITALVLAL